MDEMKLYMSCDLVSPDYWPVSVPHLKLNKGRLFPRLAFIFGGKI